jgi:hypothetical protein
MVTGRCQQIFDGVILSDGGLKLPQGYKNSYFAMAQSREERLDWMTSIREVLVALGVQCESPKPRQCVSRGKTFFQWWLQSHVSPWLTEQYYRWYPNGVKIVPPNIIITPITLANWFMGDGSSGWQRNDPRYSAHVELATNKFSPYDISILEEQLRSIDLKHLRRGDYSGVKGAKRTFSSTIIILAADVDKFMDIVSPHILPSFCYKIKRNGPLANKEQWR